jgi:DNA-binding MarR family transcriptional regulator
MPAAQPLPTLLSAALVAFTIELDNEFEREMPHATTIAGIGGPEPARAVSGRPVRRPSLVSLVMWSNFMQFVGDEGVTLRELQDLAVINRLPLAGMTRWGYVALAPDPAEGPPRHPGSASVILPTPGGRRAREVWRSLVPAIERRWQARFGEQQIAALRTALGAVVGRLDVQLPQYLPILGYGLGAEVPHRERGAASTELPLSALLSQVLLAFTLDFERESALSIAICANVLRLLSETPVRTRDLPQRSGVSKEAVSIALGFLARNGCVVQAADPIDSRAKAVRLTARGREARTSYLVLLRGVEQRWRRRFGEDTNRRLRRALEELVGEPDTQTSSLQLGLAPVPGGWRSLVPQPVALPHYPMVLHRGGYPDGS